jgi:hypothetical protein
MATPRLGRRSWFLLPFVTLVGCETADPMGPSAAEAAALAVAHGETAFLGECASCHSSRDGFDLAFFQFPDSTIVRRALAHVPEATAHDIAAYIRSLDTRVAFRHTRPFQPGGGLVLSDMAFATRLFGMDGIPAGLDTDAIRAIDPLEVAVAVPLPEWSVEANSLDWMPERALPLSILDDRGSLVRNRLDQYYANPTTENLTLAVGALRGADRRVDSASAPCLLEDPARVDYQGCFEVRRWTASLAAQHMLRHGLSEPIHRTLHDAWWDVGNVARRSFNADSSIENAGMNWAAWMYLGWIFDPGEHASVYTGTGLTRIGLPRHATFVALKSLVSRREGNPAVFADARNVAQFAPNTWALDATRIAFEHLLQRLANGERPMRPEALAESREFVSQAYNVAARKVGAQQATMLAPLRDQVLSGLE